MRRHLQYLQGEFELHTVVDAAPHHMRFEGADSEGSAVRAIDVRIDEPVVELTIRTDPRQALINWRTSEYYDWVLARFAYTSEHVDDGATAHVHPLGKAVQEHDRGRKAGRT